MAHRPPFRGQASKDNEMERLLYKLQGEVQRIWMRMGQTADSGGLGTEFFSNPTNISISGGGGTGGTGGTGTGGPGGTGGGTTNLASGISQGFATAGGNVNVMLYLSGAPEGVVSASVAEGLVYTGQSVRMAVLGGAYIVTNPALVVNGNVQSDVAAGATGTLTLSGSGGGTLNSVLNDSNCTVKGERPATAIWTANDQKWRFVIWKT